MDAGILRRDLPDRLDGLDGIPAGLLLPGRDGKGEGVHDDVVDPHAPDADQRVDQAGSDAHLVLGGARLALLVDGEGDDRRAVLLDQGHDPAEARLRSVAVLEVHRVDHRPAADELHAGLKHGRLGRVDDQREGRGARQPRDGLAHVRDPVAADVVDAHIEQVRALAHLVAGDVDAVVPASGQHGVAEGGGAVRVGALADRQVGRVLGEPDVLVQAGDAGILLDHPQRGLRAADPLHDRPQVFRGRAAASADQAEPELPDELLVRRRQLVRGQRVARAVGAEHREPRVRHAHHRDVGELRQVPQVLAHLGRAGRAVQPDHVDAERLERGERGRDLAAHEHRAGRLDGHLDEYRQPDAGLDDRLLAAVHRGLGLQQVLRGLDEQRVRPTEDQAAGLQGEGRLEVRVGGVAEARQLRAGTHRAEHPPHPAVARLEFLDGAAGDLGTGPGELLDAVLDAVVREVRPVRAEGVRLDGVDPGLEVRRVDGGHDVGSRHVEDLVAALVLLEVVHARVGILEHRTHRAVRDHHALLQCGEQRLRAGGAGEICDVERRRGPDSGWHRNSLSAR